jgi:hypothetical protein
MPQVTDLNAIAPSIHRASLFASNVHIAPDVVSRGIHGNNRISLDMAGNGR